MVVWKVGCTALAGKRPAWLDGQMEKIMVIGMLIAALLVPAAILTAIGAGLLRMFPVFGARGGLSVVVTGSAVPLVMLAYGLHLAWKPKPERMTDFVSLDWWLIAAAPPSWIACLLVAWLIAPRPVSGPAVPVP